MQSAITYVLLDTWATVETAKSVPLTTTRTTPTSPLRCGCSARAARHWKHHEKHHQRSLERHRERNLSWSRPRKRRYDLSLSSGRGHGHSTADPELMSVRHDGLIAGSTLNGGLAFETSRRETSLVSFTIMTGLTYQQESARSQHAARHTQPDPHAGATHPGPQTL